MTSGGLLVMDYLTALVLVLSLFFPVHSIYLVAVAENPGQHPAPINWTLHLLGNILEIFHFHASAMRHSTSRSQDPIITYHLEPMLSRSQSTSN